MMIIVYRDTTTKDWLLFISYLQIMQCIAKHMNFLHNICAAAQAEKVMTDYKLDEARRAWRMDIGPMDGSIVVGKGGKMRKELLVGGDIFLFFHIYIYWESMGIITPFDFHIFQRGIYTTNYRWFFAPSLPGELRDCT